MAAVPDSVDLLISGGTVVDGTGTPGRPGTVVVEGDRLRITAPDAAEPAHVGRRIDATGHVVAPGFIDLHSHGGLVILAEPHHEPKVRQGVTTEIVGVDGNGFAPFARRQDLLDFVAFDSGLDGRPDLDYDWRSVAEYLARYDGTVSINIGTLVGNSQLRIDALGWDDVPADASAIDRMRGLLREGMADGAVGLSSGLDYPPGSYATTEELAALTRTAGEAGGIYHSHVRYPLGRPVPRPVPRGDRDRPTCRGAVPHHALLPPPDAPGSARGTARPRRRRARRGAGRDVRYLSVRMGEHTPDHPAARLDPGRRAGGAQGPTCRSGSTGSGSGRASCAGRRVHRPGRLVRRAPRWVPSAGPRALGVATRWPTSWPRPVTMPSTSSATCSLRKTSASTRSRAGRGPRRCVRSSPIPSGWSAPIRPSSARSPVRARTGRSRGSSASSCATSSCCRSRPPCTR